MKYTVEFESIIKEYGLEHLNPEISIKGKVLCHPEINRPALQLAGFFEYFDSERMQIIGMVEYTYLQKVSEEARCKTIYKMFAQKIPCLVLCRGLEPFPEMFEYANEHEVLLLRTDLSTTDFMGEIIRYLKVQLAPRVSVHGVLVDVFGEGLLIMGESGIGKSEAALELIKRGHRFVADDAVEIKRVSSSTLIGSCPELIRHFIELRGIGIIDIRHMFGVQSIKMTQAIDLVIKLEHWDGKKDYDRIGLNDEYVEILGNKVVCHAIPIRPGRNMAVICEAAAINFRQKKMGYHAAAALSERFDNIK